MYLKSKKIIHRDIKPGNLLLSDTMDVKLCDFGFAALLENPEDLRMSICGTPNFQAPEMLATDTDGHSFEVDTWAFGVTIYTLLTGAAPFEASTAKEIRKKIMSGDFHFPEDLELSREAKDIITKCLFQKPKKRPTLEELASHKFFTKHKIPKTLPVTMLTTPPSI
jgi:cell cycle serine/threonine-protein kinase CDC5/MSD2